MNWYISKIVFSISAENTDHKPQFDEQLRLIAASSSEEAFLKARKLGISEEDSFFNDYQNKVKWEFINVSEVIPVKNLEDSIELYSRIHEIDSKEEAEKYIHDIHQKAIFLRVKAKPVF
jgi:hypothetical protein